ncbi:MAG: rod shape-determining protein MreD [Anaerolineae bacterium]|nr:rod shape-determining protein MreD [Anaerolineae bacterium]
MNQYVAFLLMFALALLQSTVMPRIAILGVQPDLVLMAVTSWSILRGPEEGMLWALVGGVVMDLFSGAPFGVSTLALLAVSFVSGFGPRNVLRLDILLPIAIIPLATLLYQLITLGLLSMLGWQTSWAESLRHIVLPSLLVNSLGMPIVYLLVRRLHHRTAREEISL